MGNGKVRSCLGKNMAATAFGTGASLNQHPATEIWIAVKSCAAVGIFRIFLFLNRPMRLIRSTTATLLPRESSEWPGEISESD